MFLCFSMCIGWALLFSHEVVSNFSWSHELQHARLPCPALSFGVCSDLCPLSRWFHLTISSSAAPFSSGPQSFPASGSFSVIWLFASGGQIIGASASVLPINIQDWTPLGLTVWSPWCPRDSQESSPTPQFKSINSSALSFLFSPTLISIHDYWKNHSLTRWTFVSIQAAYREHIKVYLYTDGIHKHIQTAYRQYTGIPQKYH